MVTREDINGIYEGDPKVVISIIQNLENRIKEQDIKIAKLEEQVKTLKSRYSEE
jgi:hypothetical protein